MSWIKQNTFLAGLIAVVLVGAIGLGYLLMTAKGKFAEAQADYESAAASLNKLKRAQPFPSSENAEELRGLVLQYKSDAAKLRTSMLALQKPLEVGVSPTKFQKNVVEKVSEVVDAADTHDVKLEDSFYMGMELYRNAPPFDHAAERLQFQLDATSSLVNVLLEHEVSLMKVKRVKMPFEDRDAGGNDRGRRSRGDDKKAPVSEVYPMEVVFVAKPASFQNILNSLSNVSGEGGDSDFFFVTRWLRVENQNPDGPARIGPDDDDDVEEEEFDSDEESDLEDEEDEEEEGLPMVFGSEKVNVYLALDLVRVIPPAAN